MERGAGWGGGGGGGEQGEEGSYWENEAERGVDIAQGPKFM